MFLSKQGQLQPRFQSKPGHLAHNCKMAFFARRFETIQGMGSKQRFQCHVMQ